MLNLHRSHTTRFKMVIGPLFKFLYTLTHRRETSPKERNENESN